MHNKNASQNYNWFYTSTNVENDEKKNIKW